MITQKLALLLMLLLFPGCRLGNHIVLPQKPDDGFSGYYATTAETLRLYATTVETTMKHSSPLNAPRDFRIYFTNPVTLFLLNSTNGDAVLFPQQGTSGFPIQIDLSTLSISYLGGTATKTLWDDPDCKLTTEVFLNGSIEKNATPSSTQQPSLLPLKGRLKFTLQVIHQPQGPCETSLEHLASCYDDSAQCGGSSTLENSQLHEQARALLLPWVEQEAIDLSHLSSLENFAYELTYE